MNTVSPCPSTGTLAASHHIICSTDYTMMDHAFDGIYYSPEGPKAVLNCAAFAGL